MIRSATIEDSPRLAHDHLFVGWEQGARAL
jgi:hypothetical protein